MKSALFTMTIILAIIAFGLFLVWASNANAESIDITFTDADDLEARVDSIKADFRTTPLPESLWWVDWDGISKAWWVKERRFYRHIEWVAVMRSNTVWSEYGTARVKWSEVER